MLKLYEKIEIFKRYLDKKDDSYADMMKDEIYFCFFENERDFKFLEDLNTKEEIEGKMELVISKMIMNEHQDGLENIIEYQFYG